MKNKAHLVATLQALLVTFLWSTSIILIRVYINDIPPLLFAGLRYAIAVLLMAPSLYHHREEIKALTKQDWINFMILGVVYYGITQGAQFFALKYVEMTTISLILTFTAPLVAVIGIVFLKEKVLPLQWLGTALLIFGAIIYFSQKTFASMHLFGHVMAIISLISNSAGTILGRSANRGQKHNPLIITGISMFFGALLLLGSSFAVHQMPDLGWKAWLVIFYVASVNTAFAFWLWNHAMRTLSAMETSMINNTMLIQIAVLSWIFLDETLTLIEGIGLFVALVGIFLVSIRFKNGKQVFTKSSVGS